MELVEKTKKRINDVLTVHPGSPISLLHIMVRSYNPRWKEVLSELLSEEIVKRDIVEHENSLHYRYYTNMPTGEVSIMGYNKE